tara:strand:+ start:271 stop:423 length:153 start_codon:yes stop_codon:yes gene_type:complete
MTDKDNKAVKEYRQVHCSSCYSVNFGVLISAGHDSDAVSCADCGYINEIK